MQEFVDVQMSVVNNVLQGRIRRQLMQLDF